MYVFKTADNDCVVVNKNECTVRQYVEGEQIGLLDFDRACRGAAFFSVVKEEKIPQAVAKIKELINKDVIAMKIAKYEQNTRQQFAFWFSNT